jgi:general stress protein 26
MGLSFVAMPTKTTRKATDRIPAPQTVQMPAGYTPEGTKPNFLKWEWVTERLERSHNYWVCTTRSDGRPHAAPVWGVWVDGAVIFSTDPSSRKAQNLSANRAVTVHLESGDEVVILEGSIETCKLSKAADDAYNRKYKMRLSEFPGPVGLYRLRPAKVMAWREKDFVTSATKWQFTQAATAQAHSAAYKRR